MQGKIRRHRQSVDYSRLFFSSVRKGLALAASDKMGATVNHESSVAGLLKSGLFTPKGKPMQYQKSQVIQLSHHFALSEFACHCEACEMVLVNPALVCVLEAIRRHFARPVRITSAYRCPGHNRAVGSNDRSQHPKGNAADIQVTLVSPATVQRFCDFLAVPGLGRYENFTHVDVRDTAPARW